MQNDLNSQTSERLAATNRIFFLISVDSERSLDEERSESNITPTSAEKGGSERNKKSKEQLKPVTVLADSRTGPTTGFLPERLM